MMQVVMDGRMDGSTDGWMDGSMNGWMDGCMDGWMSDGWMSDVYRDDGDHINHHATYNTDILLPNLSSVVMLYRQ